jgi:hypothetical protein
MSLGGGVLAGSVKRVFVSGFLVFHALPHLVLTVHIALTST